jgi:hypothetical protein
MVIYLQFIVHPVHVVVSLFSSSRVVFVDPTHYYLPIFRNHTTAILLPHLEFCCWWTTLSVEFCPSRPQNHITHSLLSHMNGISSSSNSRE